MQHENTGTRVGGIWLSIASILMATALVLHGPIAAELSDQMVRISNHALMWSVAHWLAAAALSLYAGSALLILTSRSSITAGAWRMSAWAVVLLGGLWTLNTAVAEATVLRAAATFESIEMFEGWWAYAEGKANGFSFLVVALAVIAASDARLAPRATPLWAACTAVVAGIGSFTGWALGMWFGVGFGSIIWVISSIIVTLWSAWFGMALARSPANALTGAGSVTQVGYQNA